MQLKRESKYWSIVGLKTVHAVCRLTFEPQRQKTSENEHVRPTMIRTGWSEPLLGALWIANNHYENKPIQIYWKFYHKKKKKWKFSDENSDIFHISAQNIVYGYSSEPPRRGGSDEYR